MTGHEATIDPFAVRLAAARLTGQAVAELFPSARNLAPRVCEHGFVVDFNSPTPPDLSSAALTALEQSVRALARAANGLAAPPPDSFRLVSARAIRRPAPRCATRLTRIRGLSFPTADGLEDFLARRETIASRDVRRLARRLELFVTPRGGSPANPVFLPAGATIQRELIQWTESVYRSFGFEPIRCSLGGEARRAFLAERASSLGEGHHAFFETFERPNPVRRHADRAGIWDPSVTSVTEAARFSPNTERVPTFARSIAESLMRPLALSKPRFENSTDYRTGRFFVRNSLGREILLGKLEPRENVVFLDLPVSHESLLALVLEETAGRFSTWLAPIQVEILPVSAAELPYARDIESALLDRELRARLSGPETTLARRIRAAALLQIPHLLIAGPRERTLRTLAWRPRAPAVERSISLPDLTHHLRAAVRARSDRFPLE